MKLSIITINYNNCEGLRKTLNSVISQTYKDFEWIVIDGGSMDGSRELIEQYQNEMAYWCSEPDKGIYHAMNKGIAKAHGEYLQFLNSGDALANNIVLSEFINSHPNVDVIYGNAIFVNENDVEDGKYLPPEKLRLSYFWSHSLNHQATFFHKRCFSYFQYDENLRIASDVKLYMELLLKGYTFQKIELDIVRYNNSGLSTQITEGEFSSVVDNILPKAIKDDYDELIAFRDVDLAIIIRKIIHSPRIVRYIARFLLYPLYYIIK